MSLSGSKNGYGESCPVQVTRSPRQIKGMKVRQKLQPERKKHIKILLAVDHSRYSLPAAHWVQEIHLPTGSEVYLLNEVKKNRDWIFRPSIMHEIFITKCPLYGKRRRRKPIVLLILWRLPPPCSIMDHLVGCMSFNETDTSALIQATLKTAA